MILDVKEILADGDMVVTLGIMELSFTTDLPGFPPATGQKVKFPLMQCELKKVKLLKNGSYGILFHLTHNLVW